MVIDHVGLVVKSMKDGIKHWETVFKYVQMTEVVYNKRQNVNVVFLRKDDSMTVKLVEPADRTSPVYRFAQRGGGLHHICFYCDDLNTKMVELKDSGLRVIAKPQPGEAFENEDIAFLLTKQGLNLELIDTKKRAKRIQSV